MKRRTFGMTVGALALTLALLAGCGRTDAPQATPTPAPTMTPLPDDILNQPATPPEDEGTPEGSAPQTEAEPDAELAALVDSIYEVYPVEIMMPQTRAIDLAEESWLKYNAGLTLDQGALVDAGVLSESLTGSQAYSLVLLRLKDAADAPAIAEAMLENIDPAKWVCVVADVQRVVAFDDKVLYVMANRELADVNALVDALPEALGVSYTLDERVEAEEPAAGDLVQEF